MNQRLPKIGMLILYFLILIISCIKPPFPDELYLQHSITMLVATLLVYLTFKNNLSNKAFAFIVAFMLLHIIGARWIYSYTPYDEWIKSLTGFSVNTYFGFKRNQYDRLIHFLFGFLILIPLREVYSRWPGCTEKISSHLAFLFILSASMIYEVFEWLITLALSPEDATAYNGQQGDFWDAQKDMALAMLGALVMILFISITKRLKRNKAWNFNKII